MLGYKVAMAATLTFALLVAACGTYSGFGFPVEDGNIETGKQVFIEYRCHRCHTVAGVDLPDIAPVISPRLELGGDTSRVKAYSELVTSVINPSHQISERYRERLPAPPAGGVSPMPTEHIDSMTVRQLIDLVAFLDSRYVLIDDYQYDFSADGSRRQGR